jgi:hypothetical protein
VALKKQKRVGKHKQYVFQLVGNNGADLFNKR